MNYTFASLGKFESFGLRIAGPGLGNILFPWATALVYSRDNNLVRIQTTWKNIKIGPFIRSEKDKRLYLNLFTGNDGIDGFKKFWLLNFTNKVKYFSGMDLLFKPFINDHLFVKSELLNIISPDHLNNLINHDINSISVHIRMGDFQKPRNEDVLRSGIWNYRLPLKWYENIINKINKICDTKIYIFSDAYDIEISDILNLKNCIRADYGSSISDMLALGSSKLLISSASTFSMWASFLGQKSTIWFPGQMRQNLISNKHLFEGELDYEDPLPKSVIQILSND